MESTIRKEKDGTKWHLILGCPLKEKHGLTGDDQDISGPSGEHVSYPPKFADCARCKHQIGINLHILDENGDIIECYPERLRCGLLEKEKDEHGWLNEAKGYLSGYLSGKRVAILGAGSIIGRRLAREAAEYGPKRLILVGHDENGLVKTQNELIVNYPYLCHEVALTDLTDTNDIEHIFHKHEPQILFHTDTWKHLYFTENRPLEAVKANSLTIRGLAEMADKIGMERFIFISTLKAAYPKLCFSVVHKMAELYLQEMATRSKTRFISVRVGNILGEEAVFVKFLRKEIIEKGTATLPFPDKGFWFLPSDTAAPLVIKAGGMGEGGEVFSLDKGRRITMKSIAKDLCSYGAGPSEMRFARHWHEFHGASGAGLMPERDIEFISDASKWDRWLIEELSLEEGPYPEKEKLTAFSHIRIVETESYGWERLKGEMGELESLVEKQDEKGLIERLKIYFPHYHPESEQKR